MTTLIKNSTPIPTKRIITCNYRLITCLPMMWKILTTHIRKEILYLLVSNWLFIERQDSHKGIRGTGNLQYIDQHILKVTKEKKKCSHCMNWQQKTYGMLPQSLIVVCLKMHKISDKVIKFIMKAKENWKMDLSPGGKIQKFIFQRDAFSPLLFLKAMMLLNYILKKCTGSYKFTKLQKKIYHLIYMDNIKLLEKNEKIWDPDTNNKNIQPGYRNGIWHRKMYYTHNDKQQKE